jgi:hypothetical protein
MSGALRRGVSPAQSYGGETWIDDGPFGPSAADGKRDSKRINQRDTREERREEKLQSIAKAAQKGRQRLPVRFRGQAQSAAPDPGLSVDCDHAVGPLRNAERPIADRAVSRLRHRQRGGPPCLLRRLHGHHFPLRAMDTRRVNSVAGKRRCRGERERRCGDKDQRGACATGSWRDMRRRVLRCMPPQANLLLFLANAVSCPAISSVRRAGASSSKTENITATERDLVSGRAVGWVPPSDRGMGGFLGCRKCPMRSPHGCICRSTQNRGLRGGFRAALSVWRTVIAVTALREALCLTWIT